MKQYSIIIELQVSNAVEQIANLLGRLATCPTIRAVTFLNRNSLACVAGKCLAGTNVTKVRKQVCCR